MTYNLVCVRPVRKPSCQFSDDAAHVSQTVMFSMADCFTRIATKESKSSGTICKYDQKKKLCKL